MSDPQYTLADPIAEMESYRLTKSVETRNRLVMHYSYVTRAVAVQMRGISSNYAQMDDIINQGILTIIECIEKFDPDKGVKFETYAFMRVRGAAIDFVRKQDWLPRRVRKTARDIEKAYDELSNSFLREPTDLELAQHLDMDTETLARHYSEITNAVMLSFEGVIQNTMQTGGDSSEDIVENGKFQPEDSVFKQELRDTLAAAIDTLTDKERTVLSLYYYENLKYSEIAQVMQVSESRVCQIHSKAIIKLKYKLQDYIKG